MTTEKKKLIRRTVNAQTSRGKRYSIWDSEIKGYHITVSKTGVISYNMKYRIAGKPGFYSIGTTGDYPPDTARDMAQALAVDIKNGIDPKVRRDLDTANIVKSRKSTLAVYLNEHFTDYAKKQNGGQGAINYLNSNWRHLHGKQLDAICIQDVIDYQDARENINKASSINRAVTALRGCLSEAIAAGYIEEHPLKGVKNLKEVDADTRALTDIEFIQFTGALKIDGQRLRAEQMKANTYRRKHSNNKKHRKLLPPLGETFADYLEPLCLVGLYAGLRRGELFKIERRDVSLIPGEEAIEIRAEICKTNHARTIIIEGHVVEVLTRWLSEQPDDTYVFPLPLNKRQGKEKDPRLTCIRNRFINVCALAQIEKFTPNGMRHTYISNLIRTGAPHTLVRKQAGHRTPQMTDRYTHFEDKDIRSALQKIDKSADKVVPLVAVAGGKA